MPIKPENRARYPKDWKRIRVAMLERAGNRCEQCGVDNHAVGYRIDGRWHQVGTSIDEAGERIDAAEYDGHRVIQIVLTIAHLDHTPENCDPSNLRAWCQRCHLAYDQAHHQRNARSTRRAGKAAGDLFA